MADALDGVRVGTSRARCVAAVVPSLGLLRIRCRTPRQMRLANGLARLLEEDGYEMDTGTIGSAIQALRIASSEEGPS